MDSYCSRSVRPAIMNILWIVIMSLNILIEPTSCVLRKWRTDRRPSVHHSKISMKFVSPKRLAVRKMVVGIHDFFRARVDPPPSNMLKMRWDRRAAKAAQLWADKCLVLEHDTPDGRWVNGFGSCGQNIFISTQKVPWLFAIKTWWLEKDLFQYGSPHNNLTLVGHYTQMVWAPTHRVGCGINSCSMNQNGRRIEYFTYICNYCPIGNFMDRLGTPYKSGKPCSGCQGHCASKYGLQQRMKKRTKSKKSKKSKKRRSKAKKRLIKHPIAIKKANQAEKKRTSKKVSGPKLQLVCTNACPVSDLWSNCSDLVTQWPDWMCKSRNSTDGKERFKHCRATCTCPGKIRN